MSPRHDTPAAAMTTPASTPAAASGKPWPGERADVDDVADLSIARFFSLSRRASAEEPEGSFAIGGSEAIAPKLTSALTELPARMQQRFVHGCSIERTNASWERPAV